MGWGFGLSSAEDEAKAAAEREAQHVAEQSEINDLYDLFGNDRSSSIPVGLYVKFEVSKENCEKARQARLQREERDRIREEKARRQYEETQERRGRIRMGSGKSVKELAAQNLETGKQVRACKAEWEAERDRQKQALAVETKVKADAARQNDARLDELEEGYAETKRREASQARRDRIMSAREFRSNLAATKKQKAEVSRAETYRAVNTRVSQVNTYKRQQAEDKRLAAEQGKALKNAEEQERLRRVAASRAASLRTHENAARAKEQMLIKKQEEGQKTDRMAGVMVQRAKSALLRDNQQKRLQQFSSRYVNTDQAQLFDNSQFRHYYLMDEMAEEEIANANEALFKRIKAMQARTDDDVEDDESGKQRVIAAALAKERREAEARKIAEENAALRQRLINIKPSIDTDISDEAAGAARGQVAAASKARKKAEALKLAKQNVEMAFKLKNVKAITDDDFNDDVLANGLTGGAARSKAAATSKAQKDSEAAKIAKKNADLKKKVDNVVARTDHDVNDDVLADGKTGGEARAQAAADSKSRKAAEAAALASENADMRERIKNTKAKVDDDITDDPAGFARDVAKPKPKSLQRPLLKPRPQMRQLPLRLPLRLPPQPLLRLLPSMRQPP